MTIFLSVFHCIVSTSWTKDLLVSYKVLTVITMWSNKTILTSTRTHPTDVITCVIVYTVSITTFSASRSILSIRTYYERRLHSISTYVADDKIQKKMLLALYKNNVENWNISKEKKYNTVFASKYNQHNKIITSKSMHGFKI